MAAWLDLVTGEAGWTLLDAGRLDSIINSMESPESQYPSFVYFVGGACRYPAMRALFPNNNVARNGPSSFINLHLSTGTESQNYPVIFAESNYIGNIALGQKIPHQWGAENLRHYPMTEQASAATLMYQNIISTFVLPWTHVVCFFIDNDNDLDKVKQFLEIPFSSIRAGSQTAVFSLEMVIVLRNKHLSWNHGDIKVMFSSLSVCLNATIVDLRKREELSPTAEFAPLSQLLVVLLESQRLARHDQGFLFSGKHLCSLWNISMSRGLEKTKKDGMDCLAVARENKQHNLITAEHIRNFLSEAIKHHYTTQDISSFLATSLLMNAYPPHMHGT